MMKKLAVLFPGIGYTADKPLLYYGRRIAEVCGYEVRTLSYGGFPQKLRGDREAIRRSSEIALAQARETLDEADLAARDGILFIGKSIGTVAAARVAAQSGARERIRLVLYTPLEETFTLPFGEALAFTGSGDPWVGGEASRIPALCAQRRIPCVVIEGANHSLETGDPGRDIGSLREIMCRTEAFIREEQLRRIARYEEMLRKLQLAVSGPELSARELPGLRDLAEALGNYYGSEDWKRDLADDEAGRLPPDLSRGVLSEDGVYNALEAFREATE